VHMVLQHGEAAHMVLQHGEAVHIVLQHGEVRLGSPRLQSTRFLRVHLVATCPAVRLQTCVKSRDCVVHNPVKNRFALCLQKILCICVTKINIFICLQGNS
jgi:hypothetical protein